VSLIVFQATVSAFMAVVLISCLTVNCFLP